MIKDTNRNYAQEKIAHRTEKYRAANAQRKRARRSVQKTGGVKPFDGKEVDHKRMISSGGGNSAKNLKVVSKSVNRRKQPKRK